MRLEGRVLSFATLLLTGPDVDRLHEELTQLGSPYKELVQTDIASDGTRQFGEGTRKAVTAFQEAHRQRLHNVVAGSLDGTGQVRWSGVWGVVDPATAQLINAELARISEPFVVRGRVEYEDGTAAEGISVSVFDRDLGTNRQALGRSGGRLTNAGGVFPDVKYFPRRYERGEGSAGQNADLVFEVESETKGSPVELIAVYRQVGLGGGSDERRVADLVLGIIAMPVETVRLVIRRKGESLPSEYERIMAALRPMLTRAMTPDLFDEQQHRDLSFAARETREERPLIETVSQAWRLSKISDLRPELFYGLLRHGSPTTFQPMPPEMLGILAMGREAWTAKLNEAFELRLIPEGMRDQLTKWVEALQDRLAQSTLHATPDEKQQVSIADILSQAGIKASRHGAFAALLAEHEGPSGEYWAKVGAQLKWTTDEIVAVQSALELAEVVSSYKPLLSELYAGQTSPSARLLARLERSKLEEMVDRTGVPAEFDSIAVKDRTKEFVDGIEENLGLLYPSEYAAKAIRNVQDKEVRLAADWLHRTLTQTHPAIAGVPAFDLVATPASRYLREHGDRLFAHNTKDEAAHLSAQLKRVQRVYQLSATPEQMPRLFEEKLESSSLIARWSHEHFVELYGERLGGTDAAAAVHNKARYIHGALLNVYLDMQKVYAARPGTIEIPGEMHTTGASVRIPALDELFGGDSLCSCAACLSVLSPAAYFVDLLQFLDLKQPGTSKTNLSVLLTRRPDLGHIQLTCDNTNTPIPYVDLVNEILASYVAHDQPFPYNDPKDGVVSGTAEELRVNPIALTGQAADAERDAYEKLGKAVYPFHLPYHHWLEVVRTYLGHFGVRRESLMRRFQPDSAFDTELAIAAETLGLSPQDFEMITLSRLDTAGSTLAPDDASLFGFLETAPPGTAPANHLTPEFTPNDKRIDSLKAVQNLLKNVSTSPGLTTAIRSKIKVNGQLDAATLAALAAYRGNAGLPTTGGTDPAFWGALETDGHRALSVLLSHVPMFLRQTGLPFDDLVTLVSARFVNPHFNDRMFFSELGIRPEEIMAFLQSGATTVPLAMASKVPAGMTSREFLGRLAALADMIVLDSPPTALCDIDQTTIRHMDGSLVTEKELVKLQQAIRLRRKLGWTLHEVDLVLSVFPLADPLTLIIRLADMKGLLDDLKISVEQLIALWDRIDTWDERSLYERLFRSKTAQSLDPDFKLDNTRREIQKFATSPGTPPLLKDHTPLLLAAFRVNTSDMTILLGTLTDGNLNLSNVSAIYRLVVLAKALDLPIKDLLLLRELSGIDPVKGAGSEIESPATEFVHLVRAIQASGFAVPKLDYLWRHGSDVRNKDLLTSQQKRDWIGELRVGLEEIQKEYVAADDPQGDKLVKQLGAVHSVPVAETLARVIYGSFTYAKLLEDFPAVPFPAALANKMRYDKDSQELRFQGVMTPTERSLLTAGAFVAALPFPVQVPYTNAVGDLFSEPESFVKQQLFDLMDSGVLLSLLRSQSSLGPDGLVNLPVVAGKVEEVLAQVRHFLSMSLIKRLASGTLQIDGPAVTVLLQNEEVLRALNAGGGIAAIEDFLKLPGAGLQATYFNSKTLDGPVTLSRVEPGPAFDGAVAVPAGVGPAPFSVLWEGYLYAPLTEDFTFVFRVRDGIRVWLNGILVLDEWKPQPVAEFLVLSKLRKGSLNQIRIEHVHFAGTFLAQLLWRSPSTELMPLPLDALYTETAMQSLLQPLERLEKIAVIARGFQLTAREVQGVSRLGYIDWNDVPVTVPSAPVSAALFSQWSALRQFASSRDLVSKKDGEFVALLQSETLDDALERFAEIIDTVPADLKQFVDAATLHPFSTTTLTYSDEAPAVNNPLWWSGLKENCRMIAKIGCSAVQLIEWGKVKDVQRIAPAPPVVNWYAMSLASTAMELAETQGQDLKRLVKAKYDEVTWRAVARPLNDQIRTSDRDALVAYALAMPAILEEHYRTADELFEFFLIDVKMGPCMKTSRIQQGIATCLLCIQRALMDLDPAIPSSSIDRQLYERMQSYALWHPSREILIHTEKYIRWDLLDRKSEPYKDFERDIRKQDLTQIHPAEATRGLWAEKAFMRLLERVDEVAKLEICGQFEDGEAHILHVFGRTRNSPCRYYYRRANDFRGVGSDTGEWTAWERIPLDIDSVEDTGKAGLNVVDNNRGGVHLMPMMWNRRLYLFWPQFRPVPDEDYNKQIPQGFDRLNKWEIKLAWSELWNGEWSPKQLSSSSVFSRAYLTAQPGLTMPPTKTITPFRMERKAITVRVWVPDPVSWTDFDPLAKFIDMALGDGDGHWHDDTSYVSNWMFNELVPEGLEIKGEHDYAVYTVERSTRSVAYFLPIPRDHFFEVREIAGRLAVTATVRYNARVSGKEITTIRRSLTSMIDGKLAFRERTEEPIQTDISTANPRQYYGGVGQFVLGTCKVRDVETISTESSQNFYSFRTPQGAYNSFQACSRTTLFNQPTSFVDTDDRTILRVSPPYSVFGEEDLQGFHQNNPFFYQNRDRVYLVTPLRRQFRATPTVEAKPAAPKPGGFSEKSAAIDFLSGGQYALGENGKGVLEKSTSGKYSQSAAYLFQLHCHPQICEFIRRLNRDGLFALLSKKTQLLEDTTPKYFQAQYFPTAYVATPYPDEAVAFSPADAYSQYNFEIFLYAPMRAWAELLRSYQFSEAEAFLKAVVNLTAVGGIWQFKPFQMTNPERIEQMLGSLLDTGTDPATLARKAKVQTAIQQWLRDPFNPHLLARRQISPYMQAVTLDACRHYLAAADYEFTRYTMESIPRALQNLLIVVKILGGKRPEKKPTAGKALPETFHSLKAKGHLGDFSQLSLAVADLETEIPFTHSVPMVQGSSGPVGSILSMYFCIPPNDEWARIWDTVADRLFKIRHCMNIEGIVQELPLFPDPIDPMLLVEARAMGLDISSVLDDFRAPLPHHEFSVIFEKALRLVEDVKAFAQRFETLMEKSETEGLAQLRVEQEAQWLKDYLRRELQENVDQQAALRDSIEKSRTATQSRYEFYDGQIQKGLIEDEKQQRGALVTAHTYETMSQANEVQASIVSLIPETHAQGSASGTSFGGSNMAAAFRAAGGIFRALSGGESHQSTIAALNALWERRRDEWTFQRSLASLDLKKVDAELLAARIQENISALRVENHDKTAANTQEVLNFYRERFFNSEKYSTVAEDLYPDYFQLFQLAYHYARQAEACCRFQFGMPRLNVIKFGYWNNARKGLLAGEHLHLALKQLERVYLDADKRQYEIRRDVSLVALDPQAFIELKQTGRCEFEIPERFFDGDYPGHYMRRLRGLSVTIPCIVGRYNGVNCVVTLLKNKTRIASEPATPYDEDLSAPDKRFDTTFAATQSIVTSHAQNDNGLFESDPRDGRYPPFRGAGVAARFGIKFPRETNAVDRTAFTDVIFHLPYTSEEGGEILRAAAWSAREKALKDPTGIPQRKLFNAKFESRDLWHRFLHPEETATTQSFSVDLRSESISMLFKERTVAVSNVDIYLNFKNQTDQALYQSGPGLISVRLSHRAAGVVTPATVQNLISVDALAGGTPFGSFPVNFDIKPGVVDTLIVELPQLSIAGIAPALRETPPGSTHVRLKAGVIDDIWIVVQYSLK